MSDQYLRDLVQQDSEPTRAIVIQRWIKQACINAGISIPMSDPYLRDLVPQDSEPVRAMVIQRWATLLANNVTGGGGGGSTGVKGGNVSLSANDTTAAVVFSGTAFSATPAVVANLISPDGTVIPVNPTSVSTTGFTGSWGTPLGSGWVLSWVAVTVGGGGATTPKAGNEALSANDTTKVVAFSGTAFGATPAIIANLISPDGTVIPLVPISASSTGFTASWGTPLTAGWTLSWIATPTTQ